MEQPLLMSKAKDKGKRGPPGKDTGPLYILPELCTLTGKNFCVGVALSFLA